MKPHTWRSLAEKLWERSGGRCENCGKKLDYYSLRYDNIHHRKKRSQGGRLTLRDCVLVCGPMNYWGGRDESCHTKEHS